MLATVLAQYGLSPTIPVITDDNYEQFIDYEVNGETKSRGCEPRNWMMHPQGHFAFGPKYPESKIIAPGDREGLLLKQQTQRGSLADLRKRMGIRSLDQDGYGYCWNFSTTKAVMYVLAKMGLGTEELSGWAAAAIIKHGRNEGGWGSLSLDFAVKYGVPSLKVWPQGVVDLKYDTPEMRADAATRKVTEWWDGSENPAEAEVQMISSFLRAEPLILDFNWWSHSVCGIALLSLKPLRILIDNSWSNTAGDNGLFILEGNKARPDGLWCPNVAVAA